MIALLMLCAVAAQDVEAPAFSAGNEELRGYLAEAAENHPDLQGKHREWLAALERIPQVKSLDDPLFTYGQFLQSDMNRFKLALTQKFPWFGTLRTRGNLAGAEAEAVLERFYSARNRLFAEVKRAYFGYGFLGQSTGVTEAQLEILDFMEEIVRSKYSLGLAGEDDLIRVQIELTKVEDRRQALVQMRPAFSAKLAEALGRPAGEAFPWPAEAVEPAEAPSFEEVRTRIRSHNPDLKALDYLAESREKQVALARKRGHPDFVLGIDYLSVRDPLTKRPDRPFPSALQGARRLLTGTEPGPVAALMDVYAVANANEPMRYPRGNGDSVMVSVKINVPLWRKRVKAGIREAELRREATGHDTRRKAQALDTAARMALFGMEDSRRRFDLYGDSLLPQAERAYQSLQSTYAAGGKDSNFLDLLDSVRLLLDFQLERVRARSDLHVAAADLEFLMGGPWGTGD